MKNFVTVVLIAFLLCGCTAPTTLEASPTPSMEVVTTAPVTVSATPDTIEEKMDALFAPSETEETLAPSPTETPKPTATTPTPTATPEPTKAPTTKPTATPEPTEAPTPKTTATPESTKAPTPKPTTTPEPTKAPTPKPTPKPTTKPAAEAPKGETVYITDTGKKYHKDGCQYLRESQHAIDINKAISRGYTPCSKCW